MTDTKAIQSDWAAALRLNIQLAARLGGKLHTGVMRHKPSLTARVVAITFSSEEPEDIGRWSCWSCLLADEHERWTEPIYCLIPWTELIPMFRSAFAGIPVKLDHIFSSIYEPCPEPNQDIFKPSGRFVVVTAERSALLKPAGNSPESVWLHAELCVLTDLAGLGLETEFLGDCVAALNVDVGEPGQERAALWKTGDSHYFYVAHLAMSTFYLERSGYSPKCYFPVARFTAFDERRGEATFELDESVVAI